MTRFITVLLCLGASALFGGVSATPTLTIAGLLNLPNTPAPSTVPCPTTTSCNGTTNIAFPNNVPLFTTVSQSLFMPVAQAIYNLLRTPIAGSGPTNIINLDPPTPEQICTLTAQAFQFAVGGEDVAQQQLQITNALATAYNAISAIQNFNASDPVATVMYGVQVGCGSNTNSVGSISLPTYTLCQTGAQYLYTSCPICNQDCQVAHNAWGGYCGASPLTGSPTCLCANTQAEANARCVYNDSTETCNTYNPLGFLLDLILGLAFRVRSITQQCMTDGKGNINSNGCAADCFQNHGSPGGVCTWQYPNVPNTIFNVNRKQLFCTCTVLDDDSNCTLSTNGPNAPVSSDPRLVNPNKSQCTSNVTTYTAAPTQAKLTQVIPAGSNAGYYSSSSEEVTTTQGYGTSTTPKYVGGCNASMAHGVTCPAPAGSQAMPCYAS